MNINVDLIKEFAGFHKKFLEMGAYNTRIDYLNAEIQVSQTELVGEKNLQFANRRSDIFPYEIFAMIDGVKLFCILDEKELCKNYPEFKDQLQRKIKYLEDDVDLSGGSDDHAA